MTSESHAAMAAEIAELKARLAEAEALQKEWREKDGNSPGFNLQRARTNGERACHERERAEKLEAKLVEAEKAACERIKANVMKQVDADIGLARHMSAPAIERADKLEAECAVLREALREACRSCAAMLGEDVTGNCPACEVHLSGALKVTAGAKAAEVLQVAEALERLASKNVEPRKAENVALDHLHELARLLSELYKAVRAKNKG